MTTETQPPSRAVVKLQPQFFPSLNRVELATKKGTLRWCNGPMVKAGTIARLELWQGRKLTAGQLLDRMADHCENTGFNPHGEGNQ